MKKLLITAAMGVALSGCASVIHGTSDQININSLEKGTTIYVNNVPRGVDNAIVEVSRKKEHQIRVTKEGCKDVTQMTGRKLDLTTFLFMWLDFGIVTIPADFIIGGALETSPKTYTLTPIC